MNRKEVVFFDVDDTLYDHSHAAETALGLLPTYFDLLKGVSLPLLKATYSSLLEEAHTLLLQRKLTVEQSIEYRWSRIIKTLCPSSPNDWEVIASKYRSLYLDNERSVPGAEQLLHELSKVVRIGIISNNLVEEQIGKLTRCNLIAPIEIIAISEAVGAIKPDPAIFHYALTKAGVSPSETLMIGDSISNDIVAARRVGMRAIWFNRTESAPNDYSVSSINSFVPVNNAMSYILNEIAVPISTNAEPPIS